ncbi:MAG: DUF4214 domain-containing protein [Hyphomicrobiales bacterium]|nr:DUF4214 domain-containing protein [Hyphomicrobiales bacterium]
MLRVFVLAAAAFLVGLAPVKAQSGFVWGVNGHPMTAYPGVSLEQQIALVRDLGMTSYRVNVVDLSHVPTLLDLVRIGKRYGVDILPVVTPRVDLEKESVEDLHRKSYELAKALVTIFKYDIRIWELGNELEVYAIIRACEMQDDGVQYNCAWGPAGGVGEMEYYGPRWAKSSAVLKGLSEGARAADPTIVRAMGTAGWGHTGAFTRMKKDGIEWEISVWHMYGEDPEWAFKKLAEFGKPIWVTELNHPYGSRDGEAAQADGLTKQMKRLLELKDAYNVRAAHIYELLDEPYWGETFEAIMGLAKLASDGAGGWRIADKKLAYGAVKGLLVPPAFAASSVIARKCDLAAHAGRERNIPNQVNYAFCLAVGRPADNVGMLTWSANRRSGQKATDMLIGMLLSSEAQGRYFAATTTHAEYVATAYRLVLNREPDGKGLADFEQQLATGSLTRAGLIRALVESEEFQRLHPAFF